MIRHIWSVVCSKSIINHETNTLSLIDVLEGLQISAIASQGAVQTFILQPTDPKLKPLIPMNYEVVSLWRRDPADQPIKGRARLKLLDQSDEQCFEVLFDLNLESHQNLRTMNKLAGFPVRGMGTYHFVVELEELSGETPQWRDVVSIPFNLSEAAPPQP